MHHSGLPALLLERPGYSSPNSPRPRDRCCPIWPLSSGQGRTLSAPPHLSHYPWREKGRKLTGLFCDCWANPMKLLSVLRSQKWACVRAPGPMDTSTPILGSLSLRPHDHSRGLLLPTRDILTVQPLPNAWSKPPASLLRTLERLPFGDTEKAPLLPVLPPFSSHKLPLPGDPHPPSLPTHPCRNNSNAIFSRVQGPEKPVQVQCPAHVCPAHARVSGTHPAAHLLPPLPRLLFIFLSRCAQGKAITRTDGQNEKLNFHLSVSLMHSLLTSGAWSTGHGCAPTVDPQRT